MSIRWKLLWSYAAMLIIPLIFLVIVTSLMLVVFRGDVQNFKSFYESRIEGLEENDYHHLVKQSIVQNPKLLTDTRYLNNLSEELATRKISIYIREDGHTVYASPGIKTKSSLLSGLPPYVHQNYHKEFKTKLHQNEWYQVVQFDLITTDSKPVSFFLITKIDPLVHFIKTFFPILFIAAIAALFLTHAALTYYMSKRIIRPLLKLRKAAGHFTEGNLDYEVEVQGKDEIGQLGIAFEQMRVRLKESILLQLQYEMNRKELVTNISHDLKTPLTAIKGYVDGILDGIADTPEKHDRYMKTIAAKASEMDRLIDELFLYSKLDLQKIPFHKESLPVHALLNDWADDLKLDLEKRQVVLTTDFRIPASLMIQVDPDSWRRVLGNVIQNSLKYMDKPEKTIELSAVTDGNEVQLVVQDNGQGIPPEAMPHIFERFYRAEQSRNSGTGGSGLGLAIAKQIMIAHGGDIRAESIEGEGTRIILVLPIDHVGGDGHE